MPRLTVERLMELVHAIADGSLAIDMVWDELSPPEQRDLDALVRYEMACRRDAERKRKYGPSQRRARRLLATFLTADQAGMLRRRRYFTEQAASGAVYEFSPNTGTCRMRVGDRRLRGRNVLAIFCYHDDRERDLALPPVTIDIRSMPPADVTIGQLLMIRADEGRFLREANATLLWRGVL